MEPGNPSGNKDKREEKIKRDVRDRGQSSVLVHALSRRDAFENRGPYQTFKDSFLCKLILFSVSAVTNKK